MAKVWKWQVTSVQHNGQPNISVTVDIWQENDAGKVTFKPTQRFWNFTPDNPPTVQSLATMVATETAALAKVIATKSDLDALVNVEQTL